MSYSVSLKNIAVVPCKTGKRVTFLGMKDFHVNRTLIPRCAGVYPEAVAFELEGLGRHGPFCRH